MTGCLRTPVPLDSVWQVLTDYEGLARTYSTVLESHSRLVDKQRQVLQAGSAHTCVRTCACRPSRVLKAPCVPPCRAPTCSSSPESDLATRVRRSASGSSWCSLGALTRGWLSARTRRQAPWCLGSSTRASCGRSRGAGRREPALAIAQLCAGFVVQSAVPAAVSLV